MNFIRIACCILFISLLLNYNLCIPIATETISRELERLLDELTNLKDQLSQWFKSNDNDNSACNKNAKDNDEEYLRIISNYLHDNQTEVVEKVNKKQKISTFLDDLKGKIYKIIHHKNSTEIKRCIGKSVKNHSKNLNEKQLFQKYLEKVIKCLEMNRKNVSPDDDLNLNITINNATENTSKIDNFLKFMADDKHMVEETGKAGFRPPDLQKTQEIIDAVKSSMINFNLDDDTTTSTSTTSDPFYSIQKRNIFNEFVKKLENKSLKTKSEINSSAKMKSNELFDGMVRIDDNYMAVSDDGEHKEEHVDEGTLLDNDLNSLDRRLNSEQRMVS